MASSAIDDGVVRDIFAIMDHDGPEIDKDEEQDIGKLLNWEHKGIHVIRKPLSETIKGMESVGGIGSWHNPLVVRLMQPLVDQWMVQVSVDPVDAVVREAEKEGELKEIVP